MTKRIWVLSLLCLAACSTGATDDWEDGLVLQRADIDLFGGSDEVVESLRPWPDSRIASQTVDALGLVEETDVGDAVGTTGGDAGTAQSGSGKDAGADPAGREADALPAEPQEPGGQPDDPAPSPPTCEPACQGKQCGPDGCEGNCGKCQQDVLCVAGTCASAPPPVPGDLVINELMVDPAVVPDKTGEWFEILCLSYEAVDLWGLAVRSGSKESFVVDRSLLALPGQIITFARAQDSTQNGGFEPDFVYSGLQLSNESDSLALEFSGELIDEAWYSPPTFKVKPGVSFGLDPWLADSELNDYPQAWCLSKTKMAAGDKGTPGGVNDECP